MQVERHTDINVRYHTWRDGALYYAHLFSFPDGVHLYTHLDEKSMTITNEELLDLLVQYHKEKLAHKGGEDAQANDGVF